MFPPKNSEWISTDSALSMTEAHLVVWVSQGTVIPDRSGLEVNWPSWHGLPELPAASVEEDLEWTWDQRDQRTQLSTPKLQNASSSKSGSQNPNKIRQKEKNSTDHSFEPWESIMPTTLSYITDNNGWLLRASQSDIHMVPDSCGPISVLPVNLHGNDILLFLKNCQLSCSEATHPPFGKAACR